MNKLIKISESDWKIFKKVRKIALERFTKITLEKCQSIICINEHSTIERYSKLNEYIYKRNIEMGRTFDDFRRSTAIQCLNLMFTYSLLTENEVSEFSEEVQNSIRKIPNWY